MGYVDISIFKV